jgi:hypothetical protein
MNGDRFILNMWLPHESELASDDAVFTADTGMPTVWAARYIKPTKERRIIGSFNHGSMTKLMLTGRADEVVEIVSSNIRDVGGIL